MLSSDSDWQVHFLRVTAVQSRKDGVTVTAERRVLLVCGLLGVSLACGGGDSGTDPNPPPPPVIVTILPVADTITVGTTASFSPTVTGATDSSVTWKVVEGAADGTISTAGLFTASSTSGTYRIVATSVAKPSSTDTSRVLVAGAPGATITAADSVATGQVGISASVPTLVGAQFTWTATGGTVVSGQGTRSVLVTSGTGALLHLTCTVRNQADSAVTGTRDITVVPAPVITSFVASRDTVTTGEGATLTAVYSGGTGVVDQNVGAITSAAIVPAGPFTTPYTTTTFTLTVTGRLNISRTAQVRVTPVNAPVLGLFRSLATQVPVGGRSTLQLGWNYDPGVVASIEPGIGVVTTNPITTGIFPAPGPVLFTATITTPADSSLIDTVTVTAVTPAAGSFSPTGSLGYARAGAMITEMQDGRILIAGGGDFSPSTGSTAKAELYDPATGQFTPTDSLHSEYSGGSAVTLADGRVLIGGFAFDSLTDIYDPATGQFSLGPPTNEPIVTALVHLNDDRVLALTRGGSGVVEIYDPMNNSFRVVDTLSFGPNSRGIVHLQDDRVLAVSLGDRVPAPAEIFDPATERFTATSAMISSRYEGSLALLADGRVLAVGGLDITTNTTTAIAEVYDPTSGTWSSVGAMAYPRRAATLALLPDGRLLVAGGVGDVGLIPFAETFDPVTGLFSPVVGQLGGNRIFPSVQRLSDGRVLFAGGADLTQTSTVSAVAELFQ